MTPFFPRDRTFIIAEAGINHNGSLAMAMRLVDAAVEAGADAVKFQTRTPHMSLPPHLWDVERDTPWGKRMTYLEYRQKIELSPRDYQLLTIHCRSREIIFSSSPWDINAADKVYGLGAPFIKIASASVTNLPLVEHIASLGKPVVMSTGMCTLGDIEAAVALLEGKVPDLAILACTSTYPAKTEDLNLARIHTLQDTFPQAVIGYSGHEPGLPTTVCAVALGAKVIERHITLDRSLPGTDQAASVEPEGFKRLVRDIRNFEKALGSPAIRVLDCEKASIERLRGPQNVVTGASQEPSVLH